MITNKTSNKNKKIIIGCTIATIVSICIVVAVSFGIYKISENKKEADRIEAEELAEAKVKEKEQREQERKQTTIDKKKAAKQKEDNLWNNAAKTGETVDMGGVEWTVIEAQDKGTRLETTMLYSDDCIAESGKYIYVKMKVKNNTNEIKDMSSEAAKIMDSKKRKFTSTFDVFGCVEEDSYFVSEINPGIETTIVKVYEVPKDANEFRLKVTKLNELEWSSDDKEYKYINLGF